MKVSYGTSRMDDQTMKSQLNSDDQTARFLEILLKSTTDGIMLTDDRQLIVLVNEAFGSILGKQPHHLVGTGILAWLDLFDDGFSGHWAELERQAQ